MPQHSPGAHRHAEAAKLSNPVQPTPESIAAGKKLYGKYCEECHGSAGKGDGMKADEHDPKPANLSDAEWEHGSSDGEIFTVVRDGLRKTDMKAFGSKMSAKDIWTVVTYVRTFGSKAAASVPIQKVVARVPERGARPARRDDRAYREYVREEQRRQPGCPARGFGDELLNRDTR